MIIGQQPAMPLHNPATNQHRVHITLVRVADDGLHRVDGRQFPDVEDLCGSVRRDFHMQYGVDLPTRIYPGSLDGYPAITRWAGQVGERPAVQRGMQVSS